MKLHYGGFALLPGGSIALTGELCLVSLRFGSPHISLTRSLAHMSQSKRSSVLMSDPVGRRLFSSVREVLAEVAEFPRQLVHHLLEDHRVHVLAWNCRVSRQYGYTLKSNI